MFEATKTRNVFKSRWNALFWSLSVLLTAYCSIPDQEDSAPVVAGDAAVAAAPAPDRAAALDRWDKGPHFTLVKSQDAPLDDLEKLQKASDKAQAAIAKVQVR
jgi:hypothetical protein